MAFNLKKMVMVCLMGCLLMGSAGATDIDLPIVHLFGKNYYQYEVKKKETLFSLSRRFGVTQEELKQANPSLVDGLKNGQLLLVPINTATKAEQDLPVDNQRTIKPIQEISETPPTLAVTSEGIQYVKGNLPRITLLLPFDENATSALNERFIEFYEGFLIAVDSLKSRGLSFEVQALLVGSGTETLESLIEAGALDQATYLIGGAGTAQISLLSDFAKRSYKTTILPFSSRIPEVATNNYLYQPLVSQEKMQERLAAYMSIRFAGSNYVLLKKAANQPTDETSLTYALKSRFDQRGAKYQEVVPDETLENLVTSLSNLYDNVIVPYDMNLNEATRFVTHLAAAAAKQPDKNIVLIGYPEWQAMSRRNQTLLHQLNTHLFTSFFADFQKEDVKSFQINYSHTFGKNLLNTFPKYGLMGYDLASYFIPQMVAEHTGTKVVQGPSLLQHTYGFRPESSGSGAYNQVFFFVQYAPDNRLEVKQLR